MGEVRRRNTPVSMLCWVHDTGLSILMAAVATMYIQKEVQVSCFKEGVWGRKGTMGATDGAHVYGMTSTRKCLAYQKVMGCMDGVRL